jgi:hypothetical protein
MRTPILFILLAWIALPVHAGRLFACRDAAGHVSFVDHGCPAARERREIVLAIAPSRNKTVSDVDAKQIAAWDKASRARLPASLGGASRSGNTSAARSGGAKPARNHACSMARSAQATAERERSFQIGFDERRRLSDAVLAACGLR